MCLAIPGRIIEIFEDHGLKMGRIDYSGAINTACLEYTPDAALNQYVLVHAGFAISTLDDAEAQKTLATWDDLVASAAAEGTDIFGMPLSADSSADAVPAWPESPPIEPPESDGLSPEAGHQPK